MTALKHIEAAASHAGVSYAEALARIAECAAPLGAVSVPPEVAGQRPSQDHPESCGSTQPAAVPAYQPTDEELDAMGRRYYGAAWGGNTDRDFIRAVLARVAAAPAAVQPVAQHELNCVCGAIWEIDADGNEMLMAAPRAAQQQPSVHQVAGSGLPSQAVRTGREESELARIHAVVMHVGGDWPDDENDPYTLRHVKWMARELTKRSKA